MTFHFKMTFLDETGSIELGRYHDGSIAMRLTSEVGEHLSTPTVCLSASGESPAPGRVFIRDYSENSGALDCLQRLGIIGPTIRQVPCGYATAYECELLVHAGDPGVRAL